jgi:hypothetical protein
MDKGDYTIKKANFVTKVYSTLAILISGSGGKVSALMATEKHMTRMGCFVTRVCLISAIVFRASGNKASVLMVKEKNMHRALTIRASLKTANATGKERNTATIFAIEENGNMVSAMDQEKRMMRTVLFMLANATTEWKNAITTAKWKNTTTAIANNLALTSLVNFSYILRDLGEIEQEICHYFLINRME